LATIRPLGELERRVVGLTKTDGGALHRRCEDVLRYALGLARTGPVRTTHGTDLHLDELLSAYRGWLIDTLAPPLLSPLGPDVRRLRELEPAIFAQTARARATVLAHFTNELSAGRLDDEICEKRLVLVLGGGGGAGFAHLGAFALLHDTQWVPSLIVGASMGSLLGLFRAVRSDWDPVGTLLSLPRRFDFSSLFEPFRGSARFGFPGAIGLRLREIARVTFEMLLQAPIPPMEALAIPLEVVVTGVGRGMQPALSRLGEPEPPPASLTGLYVRRKLARMFRIVRTLTANPRFLHELVFGRDRLTRKMSVIDAVGFSCAVPGVFCYDLGADTDSATVEVVQQLFTEHQLWGLTDGGVVNNVPSRIAWESVRSGSITSRNAFIYALDAFAPRLNGNVAFLPLQQIAHRAVVLNQRYSDRHTTYLSPPSVHKLALGWSRLRQVIERTREDLEADRWLLEGMRRRLPAFEQIGSERPELEVGWEAVKLAAS
jgi:predicted acylesterase/phospholipase RssA